MCTPESKLADEIGRLLTSRSWTLAVAESCTGGLIGHCLTQSAGSSSYFLGGVIAYANRIKVSLLDVSEAVLQEHGAVSDPVARQMASGVRLRLGSDVGLGITGIMGPGGGSEAKPVGLAYVALATKDACFSSRLNHDGTRAQIKELSCRSALTMLRNVLRQQGDQDVEETRKRVPV